MIVMENNIETYDEFFLVFRLLHICRRSVENGENWERFMNDFLDSQPAELKTQFHIDLVEKLVKYADTTKREECIAKLRECEENVEHTLEILQACNRKICSLQCQLLVANFEPTKP